MSPLTLRRAYMPRPNGRKPTPPHPAAIQAAAANQAQPPAPHLRPETKTENYTAQHWTPKLTRFNPGHDWETEVQVAAAFKRPLDCLKKINLFTHGYPNLNPLLTFT